MSSFAGQCASSHLIAFYGLFSVRSPYTAHMLSTCTVAPTSVALGIYQSHPNLQLWRHISLRWKSHLTWGKGTLSFPCLGSPSLLTSCRSRSCLADWPPSMWHRSFSPPQPRGGNRSMPKFFSGNLTEGRGLFACSIVKAQAASLPLTHAFAALISIINAKLPMVGELLPHRLVWEALRK